MSERTLRLILAGVMLMTLFLPWHPLSDSNPEPTWVFMLWVTTEAAAAVFRGITGIYLVNALCFMLSSLTVPLLVLLNVRLAVRPFRGLKMLHRVALLALTPLTLYTASLIDPVFRRCVGFWANIAVVLIAALVEIIFLVSEHHGKPQDSAPS